VNEEAGGNSGEAWAARALGEAERALAGLRHALPRARPRVAVERVGRVVQAGDGVATAVGLDAMTGELVRAGDVPALVDSVRGDRVRLVLLGDARDVEPGDRVRRTGGGILEVPTGPELVGRVVDPLGRPVDGLGPLRTSRRVRVHSEPVPLVDREPVSRPLRTGLFVLDTMIPIGRGQRQLVIGDRSTGKTELGLDVLAAQGPDVTGVFCAIGRRGSEVASDVAWLRDRGVLERGFAVVTDADDPPGVIHLAPYAAAAMAEDLALAGRDVLLVLDDLTSHAHVHRSLALLLGRPVGREAFPADVFFAHAGLLERACQLGRRRGGGSLTALPIVETQAGDLTAFIPTNIVSITDGQVRLDAGLAAAGQVPAVDVGLSVSRVGGKAQPPAVKRVAGQLKNRYSQFLEVEVFTRFGSRLEASTRHLLARGRRVREALRQPRGVAFGWAGTVGRALLLGTAEVERVPVPRLRAALEECCVAMRQGDPLGWRRLEAGEAVEPAALEAMQAIGRVELERWGEDEEAGPA